MSLICIFDREYNISVDTTAKDELQKLLYCKHIKNIIVDTDSTATTNGIVPTDGLKNTMYIFPTVITEHEQVQKIQNYTTSQDQNEPKTPIMLIISPSLDTNMRLAAKFEVSPVQKIIPIICPLVNLKTLIDLLQNLYFGSNRLVNQIQGDRQAPYFELLNERLNKKYSKLLRENGPILPTAAQEQVLDTQDTSNPFNVPEPQLQPQQQQTEIESVGGTPIQTEARMTESKITYSSEKVNIIITAIQNIHFRTHIPDNNIYIVDLENTENTKFSEILVDFFYIDAEKHPDFKGMDTGVMPPKQELHSVSAELFAKHGIKLIKRKKHQTIQELENTRAEILNTIKKRDDNLRKLYKEYDSNWRLQEILKVDKAYEKLQISESKTKFLNDIMNNKDLYSVPTNSDSNKKEEYKYEDVEDQTNNLTYTDFVNDIIQARTQAHANTNSEEYKNLFDKYLKIKNPYDMEYTLEDSQNIRKRMALLMFYANMSEKQLFISNFLRFLLMKQNILDSKKHYKNELAKVEYQISIIKGQFQSKKQTKKLDKAVAANVLRSEARNAAVFAEQSYLYRRQLGNNVNAETDVNLFERRPIPTGENIKGRLETTAKALVNDKLYSDRQTLKKATNQLATLYEKYKQMEPKCERTTRGHTLKKLTSKKYREACKLEAKITKLQEHIPEPAIQHDLRHLNDETSV
jgi:uncharacterized coiled-coil protein SlyX